MYKQIYNRMEDVESGDASPEARMLRDPVKQSETEKTEEQVEQNEQEPQNHNEHC